MRYAGIAVSKRACDVCVVDARGRVLERGRYPNTPEGAARHAALLGRRYRRGRLVVACGTADGTWPVSHAAFEEAGIDTRLADTYREAPASSASKMAGKADAEATAQALRMGAAPEFRAPDIDAGMRRRLARRMKSLVRDRTRAADRLRALLDMHGRKVGASRLYLETAIAQVKGTTLGGGGGDSVDTALLRSYVGQIESLNEEIRDIGLAICEA